MKKLIYTSLILSLFVGVLAPDSASAQYYYNNNSAQIAQIQAQLDSLKAQLNSLGYNSYNYSNTTYSYNNSNVLGAYSGPSCNFTYDMSLGSSGTEVAALNQLLGAGGGSYFGQETYNAVVRFQNQYASEILYPANLTNANGYVGAFTRAKLNSLCNGVSTSFGSGQVLGANSYNAYNNNYTNPYNYNYGSNYGYNYGSTYNYNTAAPTVNFYATPSAVSVNQTFALVWNTTNASTCRAGGAWSGDKIVNSSETRVASVANQTYTLTCTGYNGEQITRSVVVGTGSASGSGSAPIMNFYANPPIVYSGGTTTLYWTTYNASTCVASGSWSGTKGTTGNESVAGGSGGRTYTLACANSNGDTTTQSVTVGSIN